MSVAGKRGNPLILLTDVSDVTLKELDLGAISMNGDNFTFRVWNNRDGLAGVPKATGVNLVLKASPKSGHSILLNDIQAILCKCTYSAELQADPSDSYTTFPKEGTNFDEIGSQKYNEYDVLLDGTQLSDEHQAILNGTEWKLYIVVESVSGGLELVQP